MPLSIEQTVLFIIIAIIVGDYLLNMLLLCLDIRNSVKDTPIELKDCISPEKRTTQRNYMLAHNKTKMLDNSVSLAYNLLVVCWGLAYLNNSLLSVTDSQVWHAVLLMAVFVTLQMLVELPTSVYSTFGIEARYGFNRTTPGLFIKDNVIAWGLSILMQSLLMAVVVWGYMWSPTFFWLIAWGAVSAIIVFLNLFYPQIIVPLFNKQQPLEAGELRDAIHAFAREADFEVEDIFTMDASKRSTKANAYFTSLGKKKRIVLYDTLINQLSTDEIVAVLAHEIGHQKHHHTALALLSALLQILLLFALFGLVMQFDVFANAVGCEPTIAAKFVVFMLLFQPVHVVLEIIGNIVSRQHENTADAFARDHGMGASLISALKRMAVNDLVNPVPHPFVVFIKYSHPTLWQRIKALQ